MQYKHKRVAQQSTDQFGHPLVFVLLLLLLH